MAEDNNNKQLELKHNIGDTVQLQFFPGKEEERYYVKLVGFLQGKSIIVTTPRDNGVALRIPVKQDFIVRLVSGNSAKGFSATAIHATSTPYPHLHLTYPEKLESITVRKAERIDCKLIVAVHTGKTKNTVPEGISATMNNLSTAGAQITSSETIADSGEEILISCQVIVAEIKVNPSSSLLLSLVLKLNLSLCCLIEQYTKREISDYITLDRGYFLLINP